MYISNTGKVIHKIQTMLYFINWKSLANRSFPILCVDRYKVCPKEKCYIPKILLSSSMHAYSFVFIFLKLYFWFLILVQYSLAPATYMLKEHL